MDLTKRHIFVNTSTGHNKYWIVEPDGGGLIAIRNGRIGTRGQTQKPTTLFRAQQKISDKLRSGYHEIDDRKFRTLTVQAEVLGSQNKCNTIAWVQRAAGSGEVILVRFEIIPDELLNDPSYDPFLLVEIELRFPVRGRSIFRLVFTPRGAFDYRITNGSDRQIMLNRAIGELVPIAPGHPLVDLTATVEQMLGKHFNG